jgi:hypothetical protein
MSAAEKKGWGSTMLLMILGVLALYGGVGWLMFLIPVALLLWYLPGARNFPRSRS